jgi:hypothetical protein
MKRGFFFRLFMVVAVAFASILLLSYVHARTARAEEQNCDGGKCPDGKVRTEYILWESLTHNFLTANR